jgi:protein-S-isoprenylcysteine O-methyltransferase Ste14
MITQYTVFVCLFLASLVVRTGYELLKRGGLVNPENKILFAVILIDMVILWSSWFGMCPVDPHVLILPELVKTFGLTMVLIGLAVAVGALVQLKGVENIDHLVTTGLFAITRHPMYLGFVLWIIGWSVYNAATVSFFAGCLGIMNILFWRHLEEEKLSARYGGIYTQHQMNTRF